MKEKNVVALASQEAQSIKQRTSPNFNFLQHVAVIGSLVLIAFLVAIVAFGIQVVLPKDNFYDVDTTTSLKISDNEERYTYKLSYGGNGKYYVHNRTEGDNVNLDSNFFKAKDGASLRDVINEYKLTMKSTSTTTDSRTFKEPSTDAAGNVQYWESWYIIDSNTKQARTIREDDKVINGQPLDIHPIYTYNIDIVAKNYLDQNLTYQQFNQNMDAQIRIYNTSLYNAETHPFTISYVGETDYDKRVQVVGAYEGFRIQLPNFAIGGAAASDYYNIQQIEGSSFTAGYYIGNDANPLPRNEQGYPYYYYSGLGSENVKGTVNLTIKFNTNLKVTYSNDSDLENANVGYNLIAGTSAWFTNGSYNASKSARDTTAWGKGVELTISGVKYKIGHYEIYANGTKLSATTYAPGDNISSIVNIVGTNTDIVLKPVLVQA